MSSLIETRNPATGEALPPIEATSPDGVAAVVDAASRAQIEWAQIDFDERAAAARRFVEKVSEPEFADALARSIATEMGKPMRYARAEVRNIQTRSLGFVERARETCQDEVASEGGIEVTTQWRPLGVVAVIAPWNFPVSTPNNLVMSALLTGNAAVLKPSEFTPVCGALYHEALAGLVPEGLFGLVQGAGPVGRALVASEVDMIAFTGSIATGQAIMREAAGGMKRLVLELGGKDPMIVLPGADVDAAATFAARNSLMNSGQVCVSTERIFVHADLEDAFLAKVRAEVAKLSMGDPMSDDTDLGPMANEGQRALVLAQLAEAQAEGAEILVAGEPRGPGYWLGPSVVRKVADGMRLAKEETFGPVVAVSTFKEVDEVVRRANASQYGLGACVWGPAEDSKAVADRLDAGMIGINRGLSAAAGAPWVGWKLSGYGYSRSTSGMRNFMQPRTHARNIG